jgi:hypothetical protein
MGSGARPGLPATAGRVPRDGERRASPAGCRPPGEAPRCGRVGEGGRALHGPPPAASAERCGEAAGASPWVRRVCRTRHSATAGSRCHCIFRGSDSGGSQARPRSLRARNGGILRKPRPPAGVSRGLVLPPISDRHGGAHPVLLEAVPSRPHRPATFERGNLMQILWMRAEPQGDRAHPRPDSRESPSAERQQQGACDRTAGRHRDAH